MVRLTPKFTLLATALSSLAAVSMFPAPTDAAVLVLKEPEGLLAARHSDRGKGVVAAAAAAADDQGGDGDAGDSEPAPSRSGKEKGKAGEKKKKTKSKDKAKTGGKDAPAREHKPTVPLPAAMAKMGKKGHEKHSEEDEGHGKKEREKLDARDGKQKHMKISRSEPWDVDPVSRMRSLWMGSRGVSMRNIFYDKRSGHAEHESATPSESLKSQASSEDLVRRHHDDVVVEGHGNDIYVDGDRHRHWDEHWDHHHHDDPVVLNGDHEHVKIEHRSHSRRSPAPPSRYRHKALAKAAKYHEHHRRSPSPEPHSDRHRHHGWHHGHPEEVVVKGHDNDIHVPRGEPPDFPILIAGNRGESYMVMHAADDVPARRSVGLTRRDGSASGVPGTVDIITQGSAGPGQHIASLVLASARNETQPSSEAAGDPSSGGFILNASDSDRTQMYLVPVPSGGPALPTPSPPVGAPTPTGSSAPDNSTSSASPGTAPSNATVESSAMPDSFLKVFLQMPVFDADSAQLKSYCATYDPSPSAPSAMTVESCTGDSAGEAHKSQVFAYEPDTGVIRPVWSAAANADSSDAGMATMADDGTGSSTAATQSSVTTSDASSMPTDTPTATSSSSATSTVASATSSDSSATPPGPTAAPPSDTPTEDDPSGIDDFFMSTAPSVLANNAESPGVTSFDQEALDGENSANAPPPAPPMRYLNSFSAQQAQNVTLMFTPAAPEVFSHSPAQMMLQNPSPTDASTTSMGSSSTPTDSLTATVTSSTVTSSADFMTVAQTSATSSTDMATTTSTPTTTSDSQPTMSSSSVSPAAPTELDVKVYNPNVRRDRKAWNSENMPYSPGRGRPPMLGLDLHLPRQLPPSPAPEEPTSTSTSSAPSETGYTWHTLVRDPPSPSDTDASEPSSTSTTTSSESFSGFEDMTDSSPSFGEEGFFAAPTATVIGKLAARSRRVRIVKERSLVDLD